MEAQLVDGLCQRWGQPPDVILRQDAHYVLRMLALVNAAQDKKKNDG